MSKIDLDFNCETLSNRSVGYDSLNCEATEVDVDDIAEDVIVALSVKEVIEHVDDDEGLLEGLIEQMSVGGILDHIGLDKAMEHFEI